MRPRGARAIAQALLAGLLALLAADAAHAHARSASWSSWRLEGREARAVLRVDRLELTRLPWGPGAPGSLPDPLVRYLADRLRLVAGETACPVVEGPRALAGTRERASVEWRVRCPDEGALRLESALFAEVAPSHLHFARVRGEAGVQEAVLGTQRPALALTSPGAPAEAGGRGSSGALAAYVSLGVQHIGSGADHLVFLLGLLLLARRVGEVATIVTGFTLAHSLTLALAVLGRLRPEPAAVEALIGLSIALVAAENAWLLAGRPRALPALLALLLAGLAAASALGAGAVPALAFVGLAIFVPSYFGLLERSRRPMRVRVALAFAFGLVHGFGFAGVLAELSLPPARLARALLGFNVGVELGQLAAILAVWPLLAALRRWRRGGPGRVAAEVASAGVAGLGVFWLVARGYGGG